MSANSLWSGRFDAAPDADVFAYGKSLPVDKRLLDDDIAGSDAWARALGKAGVLSPDDVVAITRGLDDIRLAVHADATLISEADDEDVHSFVERELIARIGDTGKRLHTGRSRNDANASSGRCANRTSRPSLASAVDRSRQVSTSSSSTRIDSIAPILGRLRRFAASIPAECPKTWQLSDTTF